MVPPPPEEDEDDLDEVLGLDHRPRSSGARGSARDRQSGRTRREPVRRWSGSKEGEETWDDEVDDERPKGRRDKPPVFWRARDSLYFEPLVALAILAVLLVALFAYTANWPPVYVVESNSMQHGDGDHIGVLNAGDIVLAQKVPVGSIATFESARGSGLSTYGLLGDVILYYPNGTSSATPVIHRAIIYLQYDAQAGGSYNVSGLAGQPCGTNASSDVYYARGTPATSGSAANCGTTGLVSPDNLSLFNVGGRTVTVNFATDLQGLGGHSGFLTLGDNNTYPDQIPPLGDPYRLSTLVEPSWVIGVARGLIPWFGAVKLLLDGNSGKVPTASWEFLGLTIAGMIFAAAGLHFLARRERETGLWRRRREDDEEGAEPREPSPKPPPVRTGVRPWKTADPPPEKASATAAAPRRMSYEQRRRAHFVTAHERRLERPRKGKPKEPDESDGSESTS